MKKLTNSSLLRRFLYLQSKNQFHISSHQKEGLCNSSWKEESQLLGVLKTQTPFNITGCCCPSGVLSASY